MSSTLKERTRVRVEPIRIPTAFATQVQEIPNTRFIYLRSASAVFRYNQSGSAIAPLDPTANNVLALTQYRKASLFISGTKAKKAKMLMGQVNDQTAAVGYDVPMDGCIHTFDIVGPEMEIILSGAPPNASEGMSDPVQIWVYLTS